jgi:hypothetical protein
MMAIGLLNYNFIKGFLGIDIFIIILNDKKRIT